MENQLTPTQNVVEILSDGIIDPIDPMRSEMDRDALYELADNIKQNGLINPITVRPMEWCATHRCPLYDGHTVDSTCQRVQRYEVVAGHRRFTACKIAGIIRIPCVVRTLTNDEVFAVKAAENLERSDIDPVDEARFLTRYINTTGKTIDEVAKQLNRSTGYVETRLAIGSMDDHMQDAIKFGGLKLGAALKLAEISDARLRHTWTEMAVRDGISVAQADYWLHGWKMNQLPGGTNSEQPPEGFAEVSAAPVRFRCQLTGIEEDARQFRTALIHESAWPTLMAIAEEYQKSAAQPAPGEAAAEPAPAAAGA